MTHETNRVHVDPRAVDPLAMDAPFRVLLLGLQNEDGGWGSYRHRPSNTEATSLAVLALSPVYQSTSQGGGSRVEDRASLLALSDGLSWLRTRQNHDGSWPLSDQVPVPSWATPLGVLALARFPGELRRAVRGAEWLLGYEGRGYSWLSKLALRLFPERDVIELDPDLKGWPWSPETFSWVEPTAYALIALKTLRAHLPEKPTTARIDQGERMILDRACTEGGWNYGNSVVFGEELWPYPDTTALALIALSGHPDRSTVSAGFAALRQMLGQNDSGLALSLAIMALDRYGQDTSDLRARLAAGLDRLTEREEVRTIALAELALGAEHLIGGDGAT